MASVNRDGENGLKIGFFIAEPIGILLLPFQGCGALSLLLACVSIYNLLFVNHSPLNGSPLGVLLGLFLLSALCLFIGSFQYQRLQIDRLANQITLYRGPLRSHTYDLQTISHFELVEVDDEDDGSARALIYFRNGTSVPLNAVNTGNVNELQVLVREVNQFLPGKQHPIAN